MKMFTSVNTETTVYWVNLSKKCLGQNYVPESKMHKECKRKMLKNVIACTL